MAGGAAPTTKCFLDMLKSKMGETASVVHTVYMLFFRFNRSHKKLFVSYDFHFFLFVFLALMLSKVKC